MKSRLLILIFIIVCSFILSNTARERLNNVYQWDKSGYHLYLPAVFIYKDISHLNFYSNIDSIYHPAGAFKNYELYQLENGNRVNKYAIGVAFHETPFFLTAHFINAYFLNYPADGYSLPYQWATILSGLFWVVMGLFILRRFLLYYFSDAVTTIVLLLIVFGTNLYHYTVFSPGMAHTTAFFHFSCIMLFTHKLYTSRSVKYIYALGIVGGLIAITRSANLLVILVPLLWRVYNKTTFSQQVVLAKKYLPHIFTAGFVFLLVILPQVFYWKSVTGEWFYNAYQNEGFIWSEPRIIQGLLGFQKGWFVYTPIALFALYGILCMRKHLQQHIPAVTIFIVINIYVIFSWWNWWYGGGFSCRPLIESFAVLALPLGAFITQIQKYVTTIKAIIFVLLFGLVLLNMFQSYQQWKNIIHWDKMTREYYTRIFLKTNATEGDKQYLMSEKEFLIEYEHRLNKLKKRKNQ